MLNPAEIPQIAGDMAALERHARELFWVGVDFADTGRRVHATWQGLAPHYRAPEADQLLAATGPVLVVSASVGEDLTVVGGALRSYAVEVADIQARLTALRTQAFDFVAEVAANPDWRSDQVTIDRHNGLLVDVGAALAEFQEAQRRCANAILALYSDLRYVAENGDGTVAANEFGYTRETYDAALAGSQELPWGSAEEYDRGFWGDVGALWGGVVEAGGEALTGLGTLVGLGPAGWSWGTAFNAWAGLNTLALAFTPFGVANTFIDLPFQPRGSVQDALTTTGNGLIAYDLWGVDNARAAGKALFNIVSTIVGPKGVGASGRGAGAVAAGGGFADIAQTGAGLAKAGGRLPDLGTLTATVLQRFPGLHIPHVDLPNTDLPPTHIDAPHTDLPGAPAPHVPSAGDALPPGAVLTPDGFVPGPQFDPPPAGGLPGHDVGGGHPDLGAQAGHADGPVGPSGAGPAGAGPGTPLGNPLAFPDNTEAAAYGAREWNAYADSLPAEQRAALRGYSLDPPHPGNYEDVNGYLRNPASVPPTPAVLDNIAQIDRALAGHPVPETVLVARGTGIEHLSAHPRALEGTVQTDLGYTSTSLGDAAFQNKPAIVHLTVPEGTPALYMERVSAYGNAERELLLGRGTRWHVDDVRRVGGQWHIYGTVLP